ncbi:MAG: hypothetical protein DYG89_51195 [Caldilinea sp. CFX5]|nr:hypothetical protein [Caldilinea sp. CFX5]
MGCHSAVGVTVDQTFTLARKVPGADGWGHQDLAGIPDVPQLGHDQPEILTYFERVTGGDEFRANDEILARFFPGGVLARETVLRAAPGGDQDIRFLIAPSREGATVLNKAYMALVKEQRFEFGRDAVIKPTVKLVKLNTLDLDARTVRAKTREELLALPTVQAEIATAKKQGQDYSAALTTKYGARLKLRTFAVVAVGFERIVWQPVTR